MSEKKQENGPSASPENNKLLGATSVLLELTQTGDLSDAASQKLRNMLIRRLRERGLGGENLKHVDASDIAHDVLCSFLVERPSFRSSKNLAGFVVTRLTYRIIDAARKGKRWQCSSLVSEDGIADARTTEEEWEFVIQEEHDVAVKIIRQMLKDSHKLSDAKKLALGLYLLKGREWNDVYRKVARKYPKTAPSLTTMKRECKQLLERVAKRLRPNNYCNPE